MLISNASCNSVCRCGTTILQQRRVPMRLSSLYPPRISLWWRWWLWGPKWWGWLSKSWWKLWHRGVQVSHVLLTKTVSNMLLNGFVYFIPFWPFDQFVIYQHASLTQLTIWIYFSTYSLPYPPTQYPQYHLYLSINPSTYPFTCTSTTHI